LNIKSKLFITTLCALFLAPITLSASLSHNHNASGSVPDKIDIVKTGETLALPGNVDEGVADHVLATYEIDNNNRAGFKITFDSGNTGAAAGKLLGSNAAATPEEGDLINYKVSAEDNGTTSPGHWGMTFPTSVTDHELASQASCDFNSLTKAAYKGKIKLVMDVDATTGAYQDTFSDTITVTISDL
jgi:hypothetical protein